MKEGKVSFEEIMEKLESIAQDLEKGDLSLEESIEKFEEGMKLSKECSKILENAEKKINILIENEDTIKEESFVSTEE